MTDKIVIGSLPIVFTPHACRVGKFDAGDGYVYWSKNDRYLSRTELPLWTSLACSAGNGWVTDCKPVAVDGIDVVTVDRIQADKHDKFAADIVFTAKPVKDVTIKLCDDNKLIRKLGSHTIKHTWDSARECHKVIAARYHEPAKN